MSAVFVMASTRDRFCVRFVEMQAGYQR